MILDDTDQHRDGLTLDDLFRQSAQRQPDSLALVDPPNREAFMDTRPRQFTYAQADRAISAIGERLRSLGLSPDTVVGLQLPNVAESVLAILGILRAGMIAAPLPLLWGRRECVEALTRVSARALITCGRVGATDHAILGREIAAETFTIRLVCAIGRDLPDGVIALDQPEAESAARMPPEPRRGDPAAHVAIITFDMAVDGIVPMARSHAELFSGGIAAVLETGLKADRAILSALPLHSFAGLALALMPWLITGGTLALHHPFAPDIFAAQVNGRACELAIVPGPLAGAMADMLDGGFPKKIIAAWRAPERFAASPLRNRSDIDIADAIVFGEIGLILRRRDGGGTSASLPTGPIRAPQAGADGMVIAELRRTDRGTLAMRSPMIPRHPFPPHAQKDFAPSMRIEADGFVDTGYGCHAAADSSTLALSHAPAGLVSIGGYRFALSALQRMVAALDPRATLAALPDAVAGHRLAGSSADNAGLRRALEQQGANPLLIGAFRDRAAA